MPRRSESLPADVKAATDIVALVGEYLPTLQRVGAKFKALCPFHPDKNPSLELNPERQSYKCWSCGAGGDVFDFVQQHDRVEFPEALRMLADRAGLVLDRSADGAADERRGPSKSDLFEVTAWAEAVFVQALANAPEARAYVESRGIAAESVGRFRLGYHPEGRDWLAHRARRDGFGNDLLEAVGLVVRKEDSRLTHERFRGRLIFPIHDMRGRTIGFGGRILPEVEKRWAEADRGVAKYLNSPETALFRKKRHLYAADLARAEARKAGWIAVVEGYTDVIAAHQVGLSNCVGTLGTALGDDHVRALRSLADRVVLVFDGDEAGQKAADRSLELFLGHEVDVRVLSLPEGLDPADFLRGRGRDEFAALVERAADPLEFAIERATARFDVGSAEGARQAAESVLATLARVPAAGRGGLDLKLAKALDSLGRRLGVPVLDLKRRLNRLRKPARAPEPKDTAEVSESRPAIRVGDLDPIDRELVEVVLNQPELVGRVAARVTAESLRDAPLRAILRACYDLHGEGAVPSLDRVMFRLGDPALRSLAAGLLLPIDPAPLPEGVAPASPEVRLAGLLTTLAERRRRHHLRELKAALDETDPGADPGGHRALLDEYNTTLKQRPGARTAPAS